MKPAKKSRSKKPPLKTKSVPRDFPIVGIGASAGGLDAFTQLLAHLPADTGMGFVFIQHLDPKHGSLSAEIFSRATSMKVTEAKEGTKIRPNCIYLIPPNFSMEIVQGTLKLIPRAEVRGLHLVVDFFLQSLAQDLKNRAIGVILSGSGSDGTQGVLAVKAEGGITLAQMPKSAKFDSMPLSAITSGGVDLILTPRQIAEELGRIAHHPYVEPASVGDGDDGLGLPEDSLKNIFDCSSTFATSILPSTNPTRSSAVSPAACCFTSRTRSKTTPECSRKSPRK